MLRRADSRDKAFGRWFLVVRLLFGRDDIDTRLMDDLPRLDLPKAAYLSKRAKVIGRRVKLCF